MLPAGTLDIYAHHLPPTYREALRGAGLKLLDGGITIPEWTAEGAIALMDQAGISGAVLSVSSPFAASIAGATWSGCATRSTITRPSSAPPIRRASALTRCFPCRSGARAAADHRRIEN
jgi:hypothetical protein